MSKKPVQAIVAPDIDVDIDLQDGFDPIQEAIASGVATVINEPLPAPVEQFPTPSDEALMRYNISEATWLGVNNPAAFARWQELMAPKPRSVRRFYPLANPTSDPQV